LCKTFEVSIKGEQYRDGALAQAGDTIEECLFILQVRITVHMIVNGFKSATRFGVQPVDMGGYARFHGIARNRQPIALLGTHRLQRIQAQHHGAQSLFAKRGGLPWRGAAFKAKLGNQPRIDPVVLVRTRWDAPNALIAQD